MLPFSPMQERRFGGPTALYDTIASMWAATSDLRSPAPPDQYSCHDGVP
jgi:hypothetical protein